MGAVSTFTTGRMHHCTPLMTDVIVIHNNKNDEVRSEEKTK